MGIARLGDAALARLLPLECSDGTSPTKAIVCGADAKRRASPNSAAIVSAVRSSMPRKHRSRCDAGLQRRHLQQRPEIGLHGAQAPDRFIDRAQIGLVGALQRELIGQVWARSHASWRRVHAVRPP